MTRLAGIEIGFGSEQDIPEVIALLKSYGLPYEDVTTQKIYFILALIDSEIIGCIGLEKYGEHGLLRSLAVKKSLQNRGIGSMLFEKFMSYCRQHGISNIHLFTVDTHKFFQSRGFKIADRNNAPKPIKQTTEYTDLCPSTSCSYMRFQIADL